MKLATNKRVPKKHLSLGAPWLAPLVPFAGPGLAWPRLACLTWFGLAWLGLAVTVIRFVAVVLTIGRA